MQKSMLETDNNCDRREMTSLMMSATMKMNCTVETELININIVNSTYLLSDFSQSETALSRCKEFR